MDLNPRTEHIHYAIRDIIVPARKLEMQGHKLLKLNIGDPNRYDFDTPDFIKEAAIKAIREGKNFYGSSEGEPEVREAIAKREKKLKGVDIEPDNYLPTSGVSEGITFVLGSMVGPGDEVLMPGPCYPLYTTLTNFYGAKPVEYHCLEEEGWQPNIDDLQAKINKNTKVMVVINPNNPTGAVYPKETLKAMTDLAVDNDVLVICDEIYDLLTFDGEFHSIPPLNLDGNYVLCGGLSKVYLSPGWRIGYMGFQGPDVADLKESCFKMARARLSVNTPAQFALKAAMEGSHDHVKETNQKLKERCDYSVKRIQGIDGLSVSKPKATLYMFPKIENSNMQDDKKFVLDLMREKDVVCVHGSGFSEEYGKGYFRTVFLPDLEILEKAFDKLEEFMKE